MHIEHDSAKPPERIFAHLAEHENLADVFGAKITRLRDGEGEERNGVGSMRRLQIGPLPPFEETVTEFVPNERIEYKITKGSPLKNHHGEMRFSIRDGGGSRLLYTIDFESAIPGLAAIVKAGLTKGIARGLGKVDQAA